MGCVSVISIETPIGQLVIEATQKGIRNIQFSDSKKNAGPSPILDACCSQLDAYFRGDRTSFTDLPLVMEGTEFQAKVWSAALKIPFGETWTYGQLAESIGHSRASRAVGSALNRNPLPIIVPCHRIVPASGGIGKYGGGAWRKVWLLKHEKSHN